MVGSERPFRLLDVGGGYQGGRIGTHISFDGERVGGLRARTFLSRELWWPIAQVPTFGGKSASVDDYGHRVPWRNQSAEVGPSKRTSMLIL